MKIPHMFEELAMGKNLVKIWDDFAWYISPHMWTATLTDTGSIAVTSGTTVIGMNPSDGTVTNNDEAYLASTNAIVPMTDNHPLHLEALIQFTEGNTDDANIAFGLASSVGANLLIDDGGGMRASGTVIAIYKVDGGTKWICTTRDSAGATINTSSTTAGGATAQTLRIELIDVDSLGCTVVFRVDGQILKDNTTGAYIRHRFLYASATACQIFAGIKNGADTTVELLNVDYIGMAYHR